MKKDWKRAICLGLLLLPWTTDLFAENPSTSVLPLRNQRSSLLISRMYVEKGRIQILFAGDETSDTSAERSKPDAKILALQVLGGVAGGCVGGLAGGALVYSVLAATGWAKEEGLFGGPFLGAYVGAAFGYPIGSGLGVWGVGRVAGRRGRLPQTLLGTAVGALVGHALSARTNTASFFAGPVVGSIIGYHWSAP